MKRVIIGTPVQGDSVDFRYVDCLVRSVKFLPDLELIPVFQQGDLAGARNRLLNLMIVGIRDATDLVFIDSDMLWNPDDLGKLLSYDLDSLEKKRCPGVVVGGLYRKKQDAPVGVYGQQNGQKPDERGWLKVDWVGTGFMRLTRAACDYLWLRARPYTDEGTSLRAVFVDRKDGARIAEDVGMCQRWRTMGGQVFVDTTIKLGHVGSRVYTV